MQEELEEQEGETVRARVVKWETGGGDMSPVEVGKVAAWGVTAVYTACCLQRQEQEQS